MSSESDRPASLFTVVHEDGEMLVLNKPAGLVCHPTKGDVYSSLISRVRLHLGEGARPQLVNRLDRETSGLVLVAKTDECALLLRRLWEAGQVGKKYQAIVYGTVLAPSGRIDAPLGRDLDSAVAIKDKVQLEGGAAAVTEYTRSRVFRRGGRDFSLLSVLPKSGRKHQIRIHLAHIGHAIVGDKIYGEDERYYLDFVKGALTPIQIDRLILKNHALHAGELSFSLRGRDRLFETKPEPWFTEFGEGSRGAEGVEGEMREGLNRR